MKTRDKEALRLWEELKQAVFNATTIDESLSAVDLEKKRIWLESHPVEWIKYMFPHYAKYDFAPFHIKAINRIINNPEWYEVLSWSRELAKSTVVMMVVLYLVLTGKKKSVILAAATQDAAVRLLAPYKINLESNRRISQMYGEQKTYGEWEERQFKCKAGGLFLGIGAGDAPRGVKNEAVRPDVLLLDDYDTDESVLNPDVLDKKWDWWEKALYPTRSVSEPTLIIFCGNIIAEDCCITRAGEKADHWDVVNIRDEEGKSTWPQKNTEDDIDRVLSKISTKAQQGEYFNNPVIEGKVFGPRKWGRVPKFTRFKFLCIYADPTQSEAKGAAKNKKGSLKAIFLLGKTDRTLYIIKGFLGKMTTAEFISHFFSLYRHSQKDGTVPVYLVIENNSFQDPFFSQVFKPKFAEENKRQGLSLTINPDEERKTDKAVRIEANMEPLNREGLLVLNNQEKDDPNMKLLDDEFKFFSMSLRFHADGIDCCEGGNRFIDEKLAQLQPAVTVQRKVLSKRNKHRL